VVRTPAHTAPRSRVQTQFRPDLTSRNRPDSCLDLGKGLTGRLGVGEVLQQLSELLRTEMFQLGGKLGRHYRRKTLPVLGQVHDLPTGRLMRSRSNVAGLLVERDLAHDITVRPQIIRRDQPTVLSGQGGRPLMLGAGDENRTRTISLGTQAVTPGSTSDQPVLMSLSARD
jgi:hypothetical protein